MDLIEATKIVKSKEKNRNKLLGQKEMLMKDLKNLGFKSIPIAEKAVDKSKKDLVKMNTHYSNGEEKFKTKFGHLLEP